jgi:hypothetical protein
MWRWIAEARKVGNKSPVSSLKHKWIADNGIDRSLFGDCFFCQYNSVREARSACGNCPAKKINKRFSCFAAGKSWNNEPIAFYAELLRLNKIRKGVKK